MVRYIMSFNIPEDRQQTAQKEIDHYFEALHKHGPGGMRSQCYSEYNNACNFIHIKSFRRESVANHRFKSATFREYEQQLALLTGIIPFFLRLQQEHTFESIYQPGKLTCLLLNHYQKLAFFPTGTVYEAIRRHGRQVIWHKK